MDYNVYIVLQEDDFKEVGIFELQANWGGENVPYNPRRFRSQDRVEMILSEYRALTRAENLDGKKMMTLKVTDGLHELEWEVNKQTEMLTSNNIILMLQKICRLDEFAIYIFADDEIIEQQIKYTHEKDILPLISDALKWEAPKNIKIFLEEN